jgi:serine/threonine-protein kinase
MDDLAIKPIPATLGMEGSSLCLSPDGQWACYYKDQKLWKIRIEDGVPVPLLDSAARIYHADWGEDSSIVFAAGATSGLHRISDGGGDPRILTELDNERREVYHGHPQMLPGGKALLFTVSVGNYHTKIVEILLLETGERKPLLKNVGRAQYTASGHLAFARGETLFAVPFDLDRLEISGQEEAVVPDVQVDPEFHRVALFTVSDSGILVYVPSGHGMAERELVWVNRSGEIELLETTSGLYHSPRLSADGRRLAVTEYRKSNSNQIFLYDLSRLAPRPLIASGMSTQPVWKPPDDKYLAFGSSRMGMKNIFLIAADGGGESELLQPSEMIQAPCSWTPDGRLLAYVEFNQEENCDIWVISVDQDKREAQPFLVTGFNEAFPQFSPIDGRWIAYVSDESGQEEIWIAEYLPESVGAGRKELISRNGGWEPVWSRDGNELFYRTIDGTKLMAVDIRTEPDLKVGNTRPLFDEPDMPPPNWASARGSYDVAPDGRFLMISGTKSRQAPVKLVIVQNWFEELKRLCPTGN